MNFDSVGSKCFSSLTSSRLLCACLLFVGLLEAVAQVPAKKAATEKPAKNDKMVPIEETPWELQPYLVEIRVAFGNLPSLQSSEREEILVHVAAAENRVMNDVWDARVVVDTNLSPVTPSVLAEYNWDNSPAALKTAPRDKTYWVLLEQQGAEFLIAGREWDHLSREISPLKSDAVSDPRDLGEAIFRLARRLFHPLVTIDRVSDGIASVRARAGLLATTSEMATQFPAGGFWIPFFRFRGPENQLEKLQPVPWTWLRLEKIPHPELGVAECAVVSGLKSQLTARRRPRIDLLARAATPDYPATDIKLTSRLTAKPLVGLMVDLLPPKREVEEAERKKKTAPTPVRIMTDRRGVVSLPATTHSGLLWLQVKSGQKKLATLPVAPGILPELTAELPDDSLRLRLEGELAILEARLMDVVAQRAVLMARIKRAASLGQWDQVRTLRRELKGMPGSEAFLKDLTALRVPDSNTAKSLNDKATLAQVERLCTETSHLVQRFLDADKLKQFETELDELEKESALGPKSSTPNLPVPMR